MMALCRACVFSQALVPKGGEFGFLEWVSVALLTAELGVKGYCSVLVLLLPARAGRALIHLYKFNFSPVFGYAV